MPNKDGSGKGQMAAWKVSHLRALRVPFVDDYVHSSTRLDVR